MLIGGRSQASGKVCKGFQCDGPTAESNRGWIRGHGNMRKWEHGNILVRIYLGTCL